MLCTVRLFRGITKSLEILNIVTHTFDSFTKSDWLATLGQLCYSHLSNKWGDSLIDFGIFFHPPRKNSPSSFINFLDFFYPPRLFQPPSLLHTWYNPWFFLASFFTVYTVGSADLSLRHTVRLFHFEFDSMYVLHEM